MMTEAPERIWRVAAHIPRYQNYGLVSWPNPEHAGEGATEYVRADLASDDANLHRPSCECSECQPGPMDWTDEIRPSAWVAVMIVLASIMAMCGAVGLVIVAWGAM